LLHTTRSSNDWKNIGWGNTPSNADLQSFITKPAGWRCQNLTKNKSKKEIKTAPTKDNQLHLLTDTPIAKIWRESTDLALLRCWKEHHRGRDRPERPYFIAPSSPLPCWCRWKPKPEKTRPTKKPWENDFLLDRLRKSSNSRNSQLPVCWGHVQQCRRLLSIWHTQTACTMVRLFVCL
jgi:hypothetical protein